MITDNAIQRMLMVCEKGVVLADAPVLLPAYIPKAIAPPDDSLPHREGQEPLTSVWIKSAFANLSKGRRHIM